ncbi:MAG: LysR family transcriptional regulator [Clostridiales bacterium]|nr:LysR family transcriptional regulator [Clostridiales bacterium]
MQLESFEYVLAVLQCGSISMAAKKLYMSQPLLSQKIRSIERELDITIFNRYKNPISLTCAGESFVRAATQIGEVKNNLLREIGELKGEVRGRLSFAVSIQRALYTLPELLPKYKAKYPNVEISINSDYSKSTFSAMVQRGEADFALVSYSIPLPDLEYTFLHSDRIILFGGFNTDIAKRYEIGSVINITEAQNEKFVAVQESNGFRKSQDKVFQRAKIAPQIVLETTGMDLACRLAIAIDCVSLCPEAHPAETRTLKENAFYCYLEPDEEYQRKFAICYRKNMYLTKYMRDFIEMTQELYRDE